MSLDIIHPRVQGANSGSEFVEHWSPRPKRAPTPAPRGKSRLNDPEFVSRFRVLFRQGLLQKTIGEELGLSKSMVTHYRTALGIKSRRLGIQEDGKHVTLCVTVPVGFYTRFKRHCGKQTTMSAFMRAACHEKIVRETAR